MRGILARLGLIAALLLAPISAQAVIGTPAQLGHKETTGATTGVITTAANDCPVGSTIVLAAAYATTASTLSTVADSAGNVWQTPVDNTAGASVGVAFAFAYNTTVDLPIGGTITATFAGSTNSQTRAMCVSGLFPAAALDTHNHTATGTATTATSVATGTLAQANELIFGELATAATASGYTPGGGYSNYATTNTNAPSVTLSFKSVAATTTVTFAPGWTSSSNYVSNILSFKGANPPGPLMLTGVGQ